MTRSVPQLLLIGLGDIALAGALIPLGAIELMLFAPLAAGAAAWCVPAPTTGRRLLHALLVAVAVGIAIYVVALAAALMAIPKNFDRF